MAASPARGDEPCTGYLESHIRPIMITFESTTTTGGQIYGTVNFKLAGAPDNTAFHGGPHGGLPNQLNSGQTYYVDSGAYYDPPLDVAAGATGHCPSGWTGVIGSTLITLPEGGSCTEGYGEFFYGLIPCRWVPACRECPNAGKPVNIATGNVWFDATDATLPNLVFTRSYNSLVAYANGAGVFGKGWHHSFEKSIQSASNVVQTANLMLVEGDGTAIYFKPHVDGTLRAVAPVTERSWLVPSGGGYTRNFLEGGYETYDSSGRVSSIVPQAGPTVTLLRDASGRLSTISDGARTLTVEYDSSSSRVSRLTGPAGLIASYYYTASGMLETVAYPDGSGYRYAYDASGSYVAAVSDFSGRVLERHTYDGEGRGLTSETDGGRERLTFDYSVSPVTKVTDALGTPTVYSWRTFLTSAA